MKTTEIVLNIWFTVDMVSDLCYSWRIKTYNINGTDDEKLNMIIQLSETDYITIPERKLPSHFSVIQGNDKLQNSVPANAIQDILETNFDYFISIIETELPILKKIDIDLKATNIIQEIPASPLYNCTILMENEFGEARPFTTQENKLWYQNEKLRILGLNL